MPAFWLACRYLMSTTEWKASAGTYCVGDASPSCAGVLYMPPPQLFTVATALFGVPTPNLTREQQQPLPPAPLPRFPHPGLGAVTRRGRSARRDPLEPKQNKTPFNFFSIDARARAKAEHPTADQKVTHLITWK